MGINLKQINIKKTELDEFLKFKDLIKDQVNLQMSSLPNIKDFIGRAPLAMMLENHENHIQFMTVVFKYKGFQMLENTIPWVYHNYSSHGFSYDYFPTELEIWKKAIVQFMGPSESVEILKVYQWMIENHEMMIEKSKMIITEEAPYPELKDKRTKFLKAILLGDYDKALIVAKEIMARDDGQELLYIALIEPVMHEIGQLWEIDIVSTAEEHLATAIVSRIIASLYSQIEKPELKRGLGFVTSAPNEHHEMGARILADMLEKEGWDITFLGANTPEKELVDLLVKSKPRFLAISLTMPFNIDKVGRLISKIKKCGELETLKIIVGGQGFKAHEGLWNQTGAHFYSNNLKSSILKINEW